MLATHRDEDEALAIDGQRMEAAGDCVEPLVAAGQGRLSRVDKANGLERGAAIAVWADDVPWRGTVRELGFFLCVWGGARGEGDLRASEGVVWVRRWS